MLTKLKTRMMLHECFPMTMVTWVLRMMPTIWPMLFDLPVLMFMPPEQLPKPCVGSVTYQSRPH